MADKKCAACGATNKAESNFCSNCGSSDFEQDQPPADPVTGLSNEDRRRIYDEEKANEGARAAPHPYRDNPRKKRTFKGSLRFLGIGALIGVGVVIVGSIAAVIFVPEEEEDALDGTPSAIVRPSIPRATSLTDAQETVAVAGITGNGEVVDAAISQAGSSVSLVIVVNRATSVSRAKELGDNFVRLVKSTGPDDPPGREIGSGSFDYLITIAYPDERTVAQGAKARGAGRISWQ
jgi:hypothetical protein